MSRWNVAVCSVLAGVLSCVSLASAQAPSEPPPTPPPAPSTPPPDSSPPPDAPPAQPTPPPDVPAAPELTAPEAPAEQPQVAGDASAEGELTVVPDEEAPLPSEVNSTGEEIVVTGSRLHRTAFSTSAPVTVIKREDLERNAYGSLSDLARQLSESGGNSSGSSTSGAFYENQGVQMINLRGLGANATLVLVNGRRLIANGPGGALETFSNVATIPVAMIERIEILRGGASAIYGSDAVAGVVNIITRKKTNGVSTQVNVSSTDKFDQQEYEGNIVAGASTDKTSISVGLNWYHSTPLDAVDRDWTRGQFWSAIGPIGIYVPISRTTNVSTPYAMDLGYFELFPDPACPDPQGFLNGNHTQQIADIMAKLNSLPRTADERVALERQLTAYQLGQRFQGSSLNNATLPYLADRQSRGWWPTSLPAGDPRRQQAVTPNGQNGFGCAWEFRKYKDLRPELTRMSTMLSATHDLSDHVQVELEAQYADNRAISKNQPAPDYRDARLNPGAFYDMNNAPWTADITRADGSTAMQSNSYDLWYGYPASYNTPINYSNFDAQTFRGVLALKGDFESLAAGTVAETWDWELAGSYARATWDARYGTMQTDYVQKALDACKVDSMGRLPGLVQNTPENRRRLGCFNPYWNSTEDPDLANDPGLLRQMQAKFNNLTTTQLYTADATLRGEIVPLPGGPLSFAVGGQYRHESRDAYYDNDTNLNRTPAGGIDDTSKSRDVWSTYAEMNLPILRAIELQPAIRYEAYQEVGDALTPRVGLIIRVGDFLKDPPAALARLALRGTYAKAFRAPNLAQTDPAACAYVSEDAYTPRGDPDPILRRTTRSQLLNGRVCGSDKLGPEEATSYSAGIDWAFGNLHAESDFWQYDYSERIIQPVIQRAVDKNANRAFCLLDPNADLTTASMRAGNFVRTLAPRASYFRDIDCDAISREEGVARGSLSPDEFIAKYPEVMYAPATGNPENGSTLIRYANASTVMTRGIDFGVTYSVGAKDFGLKSDIGTLSLGIKGSYVLNFKYREAPPSDSIDCAVFPDDATCEKEAAGKRNLTNFNDVIPRLKFSVPLTYQYHAHQLALTARYVAGFKDDGTFYDPFNPPPPDVPSQTTFDLQYALDLSGLLGRAGSWRIGVQNLMDADPPRIRQRDAGGFEPSVHDPRGRLFYTRLGVDL